MCHAKANKMQLKQYTREEVRAHRKDGDAWIIIKDKVYDVSEFCLRHPGGTLIRQGYGRDATPIFLSSHPLHVESKLLPKLCIGELREDQRETFYSYDGEFYQVLRQRVENYFKESNKTHHCNLELLFKFFLITGMFFLCYYLTFIRGLTIFAFLLGYFHSLLGIGIMHDGNHGAFSNYPFVNKLTGSFLDLMGGSSFVWKHEHNVGHHGATNTDHDPDATTGIPLIRLGPDSPLMPHHKFQHIYIWFLYLLMPLRWYVSDFDSFFTGKHRNIVVYTMTLRERIWFLFCKIFFIVWAFCIPLYLQGVRGLVCSFVFIACSGLNMATQFVVTHISDEATFTSYDGVKERDWATLQVLTSTNYGMDQFIPSFFSGGLNFQTEHHLFPTISHVHYRKIAPIVQKTCKEFGIKYTAYPSYWSAMCHHLRHLKRMGSQSSFSLETTAHSKKLQ